MERRQQCMICTAGKAGIPDKSRRIKTTVLYYRVMEPSDFISSSKLQEAKSDIIYQQVFYTVVHLLPNLLADTCTLSFTF